MPSNVKVSSSWKTVSALYTRVGGSWKNVAEGYTKIGGAWKSFFTSNALFVDHLVIAGGGSGGVGTVTQRLGAGGGGAGGYRTSSGTSGGGGSAESRVTVAVSTNYTVTVGAGGASASGSGNGSAGSNSVFATITSSGGGYGATGFTNAQNGGNGGSGGGAGGNTTGVTTGGTGTTNQGFAGGNGFTSGGLPAGGGGGGASQAGANAALNTGGNGGNGVASSITGSSVTRGGGGGGAPWEQDFSGVFGLGGSGGGGNSATSNTGSGTNGSANTGSGGGAAANGATSGSGGSGVVILSYPSTFDIRNGAGLTYTTSVVGSNKVTVFTAGTGNIQFADAVNSSFVLLETVTLTSAQASVEFTGLNTKYGSIYQHLQVRASHIQTTSGETALMQFNGDTASNYRVHALRGNGSSVSSADYGNRGSLVVGVDVPSTSIPAAFVCDILDPFETTKNKTVRTLAGYGSGGNVNLYSGLWTNTAALTSLKVLASSGNLGTSTRVSIYGLKGS